MTETTPTTTTSTDSTATDQPETETEEPTLESVCEQLDALTDRVAELEAQIDPDPTGKEYEAMSRDERVCKICATLLEDAQHRHSGKVQMTYKEILRLSTTIPPMGMRTS